MKHNLHASIQNIQKEKWNALTEPDNPFFDHEFLLSLEQGNCLNENTGWIPHYITIEDDNDDMVAVCPVFLKTHSYGEFIFDFHWAQAYQQQGLSYYPKLVSAIPVTPVSGKRILLKPGIKLENIQDAINKAFDDVIEKTQPSSLHILYCRENEANFLTQFKFLKRYSFEYHWHNQGYKTFDDFLRVLNHKCRSQIRKERKQAMARGLEIEVRTGSDIKEEHVLACYNFYTTHHNLVYGSPTYLTKEFFLLAKENMPDRMVLILVKKNGKYVAGATNFYKGKGLFGRYWGL